MGPGVTASPKTANAASVRGERSAGRTLAPANFVEEVGRENILLNVLAALDRALEIGANFSGIGPEIARSMLSMKI